LPVLVSPTPFRAAGNGDLDIDSVTLHTRRSQDPHNIHFNRRQFKIPRTSTRPISLLFPNTLHRFHKRVTPRHVGIVSVSPTISRVVFFLRDRYRSHRQQRYFLILPVVLFMNVDLSILCYDLDNKTPLTHPLSYSGTDHHENTEGFFCVTPSESC